MMMKEAVVIYILLGHPGAFFHPRFVSFLVLKLKDHYLTQFMVKISKLGLLRFKF